MDIRGGSVSVIDSSIIRSTSEQGSAGALDVNCH
jgi:hypothetical protein